MKHIKLFEAFNEMSQTLKPATISREGETVLAFTIGDDINVALLPTAEAQAFLDTIKDKLSNVDTYMEGSAEDMLVQMESTPGIAYVYCDPNSSSNPIGSFESESFEAMTPSIEYWVTGADNGGDNPNPHRTNGSSVYVLKRGMVITASPGAEPHITQMTIGEYVNSFA